MAKFCEKCGVKIRGFLSLREIVATTDSDGVYREFCSDECGQAWTDDREDARRRQETQDLARSARAKYGELTPDMRSDLEALYYRKLQVWNDMSDAQITLEVTETGDKGKSLSAKLEVLEYEVKQLAAILGRPSDL